MTQGEQYQIDAEAARALAEWRAFFAEQVAIEAKVLARKSNSPGTITLNHYRQAAVLAAQKLATVVQDADSRDARQEAA